VEGIGRFHLLGQGVQEVEQTRIYVADIVSAVIAQEVVELSKGLGKILSGSPIDRFQAFSGVGVVKVK
jgi:hypothetical protein